MNATPLFHEDGRPTKVWYCRECRFVSQTQEGAEQCCRPHVCACGAECSRGWTACTTCRAAKESERLAKQVEGAKKVPEAEWDGPVVAEGHDTGFASVDEMRDYYECEGQEVPWPVWGTRTSTLDLDAQWILENAADEMFEDALDHISDEACAELQTMLDAWKAKHGPSGWEEDNSIVVVLEENDNEST